MPTPTWAWHPNIPVSNFGCRTRMFRLHDKTRRWVCRAAFLAIAALPTASVLVWAAGEHWPGRVSQVERELRQHLRLAVSLDDVSHPRPGHTLLMGVRIVDPESGDVVLACPAIETARHDGRLVIVASPVELNVRRLDLLADVVRRRMRDVADGGEMDVRWIANGVTLLAGDRRQTLTGVVGDIDHDENAVRAGLQFRIAGDSTSDLGQLQLRLSRTPKSGEPRISVELHTGGAAIPLTPLTALWPALRHLGDIAVFRGAVWAREEAGGWQGEISGHLGEVDLTRLISDQFPHKLSGIARVTIDKAHFQDSRLVTATLRLESDGGQIENSLLEAAEAHLAMRHRKPPPPGDRFHAYTKLRLWAELGSGEVTLRASDENNSGVVLADANGPLIHEPADKQPIINLVRTLVPQRQTLVPASAETEALLPRLPLPTTRASKGGVKKPPRSHLRLDDSL
jgi:hypothetical protein